MGLGGAVASRSSRVEAQRGWAADRGANSADHCQGHLTPLLGHRLCQEAQRAADGSPSDRSPQSSKELHEAGCRQGAGRHGAEERQCKGTIYRVTLRGVNRGDSAAMTRPDSDGAALPIAFPTAFACPAVQR